jgi:hypothetical protein
MRTQLASPADSGTTIIIMRSCFPYNFEEYNLAVFRIKLCMRDVWVQGVVLVLVSMVFGNQT